MPVITLPDGSQKKYESAVTAHDVALSISEGLARNTVAAKIDDTIIDSHLLIEKDVRLQLLTTRDAEALEVLRHSSAHIMAYAIQRLWPDTHFAIGPVVENGFYYDMGNLQLKSEDFAAIEKEMKQIVSDNVPFERYVLSRDEALEKFKDQPYKVEIINDLPASETITFYKLGDFHDLCRGPHIPSTKYVKAFKLMRLAGAYWRGDNSRQQLIRLYATSFFDKKEQKAYLEQLEEAQKRDHNKLGRELDLFHTEAVIGQGLPLLTPRGSMMKMVLQRFVEDEEIRRGYQYTMTPLMAKSDLYEISGHWEHYRDGMFTFSPESKYDKSEKAQEEKDQTMMALRPMTCPFQYMLYNRKKHSYRELPVRLAETSTLFRNESSGEMHGLTRVRQFTLADGHIICTKAQVEQEFDAAFDLALFVIKTLGIKNYTFRLSKWDPDARGKFIDNEEMWEWSETILRNILDRQKVDYYEAVGEAAFYGPKLDIQLKNVWGKEDTAFTIQLDATLADRFGMVYTNSEGQEEHPVIIHRSSIGCYERTMAFLIEQYAGKFPFWMSPEQIRLLSLNDEVKPYVQELNQLMLNAGLRSACDFRAESLGKKVREAQLDYTPIIVTVGKQEVEKKVLSLRSLDGQVVQDVPVDVFTDFCRRLNEERKLEFNLAELQ